jgi:uncharacterized membrane-anchored protein YhcB (DUF1043 family)|tara:strand:- start:1677 stop:1859 length:183 start_codon:yes stop_codon:yes gene_type:complete
MEHSSMMIIGLLSGLILGFVYGRYKKNRRHEIELEEQRNYYIRQSTDSEGRGEWIARNHF